MIEKGEMDNKQFALLTVVAVIVLAYFVFYFSGKRYANEMFNDVSGSKQPYVVFDSSQVPDKPYLDRQINSVDDYEYNVVFQNEGSREVSKDLQNKLATQYPMDWSNLPPNSAMFQEGVAQQRERQQQREGFQNTLESPYKDVEAGYEPPDLDAIDEEEKKILATYQPTRSTAAGPGKYDIEDAKELINKIYEKRGLVPEIVVKPGNIYEVVGTQEKNPKIVWEDEQAPVQYGGSAAIAEAGEQVIQVPYSAGDPDKALDPFFDKTGRTNLGRSDYRQWTPGLERMFAPTEPQTDWY